MKKILFITFILLCITSIQAYDYYPGRNVNMEGTWNITNASVTETKCLKINGTNICNSVRFNNSSWNESGAQKIFINKTSEPNLNVNSSVWWAEINSIGSILGNAINNDLSWMNWTQIIPNFYFKNQTYSKSEIDANLSLYLILTDQRYNDTDMIKSVNQTVNIQNLGFYTKAQIDNNLTLYLLLGDQRYNETNLINNLINSVNQTINIQNLGFYTKAQTDNNLSLYLLLTDQRFNDTALINSVNTTVNIQNLGFYTKSETNNNLTLRLLATDQRYNETGVIQSSNASWSTTANETYNAYVTANYTNKSNYWDEMNIINSTQMQDSSGTLNILESWIASFGNNLWCKLSGCNITGNINMSLNNITSIDTLRTNYLYGQPLDGGIGSGIIWANQVDGTANLFLNKSGLNVSYPAFKMRMITSNPVNVISYCDVPAGTLTVPDNAHTAYYVDSTCAILSSSMPTSILEDISPGGKGDFMNVMAHNGQIKLMQGRTIEQKVAAKLKQTIMETSNLNVVSGFQASLETTFPNISIANGKYVYIRDIVGTSTQNNATIEIFSRNQSNWQYVTQKGINFSACDNGTDTVPCTGASYRRYFIFVIGQNGTQDTTEIHERLPSLTRTYTELNCLDTIKNPLIYDLPDIYTYVAVPIYAYCGTRTTSSWASADLLDLRTVKVGTASTPIEVDPVWTGDKASYATLTDLNLAINIKLNITDQRYNETNLINSVNSTLQGKVSFPGYANIALTNQTNPSSSFSNLNVTSCIYFSSGGKICDLP